MTEDTSKTNSYLTFTLGDEEFAAHVDKVLNILEMTKITRVPKAPCYMKGVINLRGMVLPLIDTRLKFGMSETINSPNTCILVLEINMDGETIKLGALADSVQEVIEIAADQLQPPPSIGSKYKSEFIEGVVHLNERFIMVLNMDLIFTLDELTKIVETSDKEELTE